MKFNKRERILGVIIVCITLVLFLVTAYFFMEPKFLSEKEMDEMFIDNSDENTENNKRNSSKNDLGNGDIVVDIAGAVKSPGVYYMKQNQILNDLINEAGGLNKDADIIRINRAEKLVNNKKFYVPAKGEETSALSVSAGISTEEEDKIVDINTANKERLKTLPGIGDVTADKIIQHREKNGSFKSIEDLKNVDGIGETKYSKVKDFIKVN